MVDYSCRLTKTYPSFTAEFVWDELPMAQGWVYLAFATENDPLAALAGIARVEGTGYIAAEVHRILMRKK